MLLLEKWYAIIISISLIFISTHNKENAILEGPSGAFLCPTGLQVAMSA